MGRRSSQHDESDYAERFAAALGRTIKVRRTDLGMKRRELAERANISYSYLTEIENGNKPPSPIVLGPLAEALGLRMSELTQEAEARMDTQEELSASLSPEGEWARRFASPRSTPLAFRTSSPTLTSRREADRDLRSTLLELERLIRNMTQDDIERLLDLARRLAH
jgi:transcriptional regulator with XRE-family HTH domain